MDHSHMNHGDMNHGDMDMPGHGGSEHMCNMNMLFTWDTTDLCIVFRQWHITSTFSLIWSLLAVAALCAGYEAVREVSRRYEASVAVGAKDNVGIPRRPTSSRDERKAKLVKASLYAVQVFYSFFIMLLFMTYNGWVMLAVAVGAFAGYLMFGNASATKTVACH
ncbi:ctr copper transporter family protein [Saccharata proteae CBS 121410]|uniref:Copper transport protein n=1 Tax=Saccharata proteae CBS 121410 TaxID=1314787 RepID=A0A9P4HU70_9PEZI|nr:ctr copper transporter family protein [Saccharata proteae CBS 121410]